MEFRRWVVCAAAAGVLGGCESAESPRVTAAAEEFVSAVEADPSAACELLDPRVKDTIETASGQSCAKALRAVELPAGPVREAVVWDDAAQVRTEGDTLFLRELRDGWRITGAGCTPRGERPYDCEVGGP